MVCRVQRLLPQADSNAQPPKPVVLRVPEQVLQLHQQPRAEPPVPRLQHHQALRQEVQGEDKGQFFKHRLGVNFAPTENCWPIQFLKFKLFFE
jgi:hypothetical protein